MVRTTPLLTLVLALTLAPLLGIGQEPPPGDAPPASPPARAGDARAVLTQAISTTLEQDGFHVAYCNLDPSGKPAAQSSTELHRRPDFSFFRMAENKGEFYRKGERLVIKDPEKGTWAAAGDLGALGAALLGRLRRADQILQTVLEGADKVSVVRQETVEGSPCAVISACSSPETVARRTQERLAEPAVRDGLAKQGIADPQPALDRCSIEFVIWIDTGKNLVRRVQTINHLVIRTPKGDTEIAGSRQLEFTGYNQELEVPIPEEVRAKLSAGK